MSDIPTRMCGALVAANSEVCHTVRIGRAEPLRRRTTEIRVPQLLCSL